MRFFDFEPQEASLVQRLGAALIVEWDNFSEPTQILLVQLAADIGGISESGAQMDLQIGALIQKHKGRGQPE